MRCCGRKQQLLGVASSAMLGMICTQYKRHFLVCPRAISTHIDPGIRTGTESMDRFTVSAVGPSDALQLSGGGAAVPATSRRNRPGGPTAGPGPSGSRSGDDARRELSEGCDCPLGSVEIRFGARNRNLCEQRQCRNATETSRTRR